MYFASKDAVHNEPKIWSAESDQNLLSMKSHFTSGSDGRKLKHTCSLILLPEAYRKCVMYEDARYNATVWRVTLPFHDAAPFCKYFYCHSGWPLRHLVPGQLYPGHSPITRTLHWPAVIFSHGPSPPTTEYSWHIYIPPYTLHLSQQYKLCSCTGTEGKQRDKIEGDVVNEKEYQ